MRKGLGTGGRVLARFSFVCRRLSSGRSSAGLKAGRYVNVEGAVVCVLALALVPIALSSQSAAPADSKIDSVFAKYSSSTPGCAVGVSTGGTPVLARGYGMADLEHDVKIGPDTIFEAGSVSKQFTAAAVMLLAREGKLSLDDQVRKYVPELPDYGSSLTIRHMLSHTSGLRDWGSVAAIAGWPRTTRVHTHAHVLEIVSRQRALNFAPGTRWSYSNTGFNLAAIIVERVSGRSFQEFTHDRLFQPHGMTHTSWRDDYTRVLKGRAIAYNERGGAFHTDMPFENVYGNGGLLTTVGDLLKWNEHYDAASEADAAMIAEQQQPGRFNDGRTHGYGLGLFVGTYKGLPEVSHSGSTAGYSAFLTRFPEQRVSVAVLCNVSSAQATQYAHAVADAYLGDRLKPSEVTATHTLTSAEMNRVAHQWVSDVTGVPVTITGENGSLRLGRSTPLFAQSGMVLLSAGRDEWALDARGIRHTDPFGTVEEFHGEKPWTPPAADLDAYAGVYVSDDAETTLTAMVDGGKLMLMRRPDTTIALTPLYLNAFSAGGGLGTVIFEWDENRRVARLRVVQDRIWNLRFQKVRSEK
jgi:CubicO group peptidase (beta-lactamase class C family)